MCVFVCTRLHNRDTYLSIHISALFYILFAWSRCVLIYTCFCCLFYTCLGLLSIFFMHASDIYVYVLIRLLNSLGRFGACRGCVECLQYIYIYISSASTQPTSPFGCVFVCTRLHNRDTYLSIHISALFYIWFAWPRYIFIYTYSRSLLYNIFGCSLNALIDHYVLIYSYFRVFLQHPCGSLLVDLLLFSGVSLTPQ